MVTEGERITQAERLARIEESIRHLGEQVETLVTEVREANKCQAEHSAKIEVLTLRAETNKGEIDKLRTRDTTGSLMTGIMAIVAGILGIFVKP